MAARTNEDICNMALLYAGVNQKIGKLATDRSAAAQACNTVFDQVRQSLLTQLRPPGSVKRAQLVPISGNDYAAAAVYAKGDFSKYGPNVYRSLVAGNVGNQPDISIVQWAQVTRDGYAFVCPLPDDCLQPISAWEKPTAGSNQAGTPVSFVDGGVTVFIGGPFSTTTSGGDSDLLRNPRSDERTGFALENANDGTDDLVLLTDVDTPILKYVADMTNPVAFSPEFVDAFAWSLSGPLAMAVRGDEKKAAACEAKAESMIRRAWRLSQQGQQADPEPASEFEAARRGRG